MFSNLDVKRVRDELLRDAPYAETYEDYEDLPIVPPIPKRQLGTTGSPLRPRSPEGVSILPRLDQPPFREDLSIVFNWRADASTDSSANAQRDPDALNWTTQADHAEIVRSYYEAQAKNPDIVLPVPITRQNGELRPCTAPYQVQGAQQVPMTSRWCDDETM
jgi:hypothetical protein